MRAAVCTSCFSVPSVPRAGSGGHGWLTFTSDRVEVLVNVLGDGLDLRIQVLLNAEHVILVVLRDEIDGQTEVTKSTRSSNAMQVGVRLPWEVKVDHDVNRDDVNTSGKDIRADQAPSLSTLEVMEDSERHT